MPDGIVTDFIHYVPAFFLFVRERWRRLDEVCALRKGDDSCYTGPKRLCCLNCNNHSFPHPAALKSNF